MSENFGNKFHKKTDFSFFVWYTKANDPLKGAEHTLSQKEKITEKIKETLFGETLILPLCIFVLSRVHIYADIMPFGYAALAGTGSFFNPLALLAFVSGTAMGDSGLLSYLRHILAAVFFMGAKKLSKDRLSDGVLLPSAVIFGSISGLIFRADAFYYLHSIAEAAAGLLFYFLFRSSYSIIKRPGTLMLNEAEFSVIFFTFLSIASGFCGLEIWKISFCAVLMIFLGQAAAYKNTPAAGALCNMGMGFFFFMFSPENPWAVSSLALSGMIGAYVKKHGKILLPLAYFLPLFVFFPNGMASSPFTVFDIALASVMFIAVPEKWFDAVNLITPSAANDKAYLRISDRLTELSDTFLSIAETFDSVSIRRTDCKKGAARETVKRMCRDCVFKKSCSVDTESELSALETGADGKRGDALETVGKGCRRRSELLSEFMRIYQLFRMETMWQKRLSEESEAVSGQMKCVSGVFKKLIKENEAFIKRDFETENRLISALKREGVAVKRLSAGTTYNGAFEVRVDSLPCKGSCMCDSVMKKTVEKTIGSEVERVGIKNCKRCSVGYSSLSPFGINAVKLSIPLENVSGDSAAFARVDSEHYAIALSDGMGTGAAAARESSVAAHMAMRLLSSGMDICSTAKMINSLLLTRCEKSFATLDLALINVFSGEVEYLKNGAASGYIFTSGGKVKVASGEGSPLGAVGDAEMKVKKLKLSDGDVLILVSDGVADAFGPDGEKKLFDTLSDFTPGSIDALAEFIAKSAYIASGRKIKDDMTVIAAGCIKRKRSGNNMGKKEA